jgi:hypothetical protein
MASFLALRRIYRTIIAPMVQHAKDKDLSLNGNGMP